MIFLDQNTEFDEISVSMIILLSHCLDFIRIKDNVIKREGRFEYIREMKSQFIKDSYFLKCLYKLGIKMSRCEEVMIFFSRIFMNISLEDNKTLVLLVNKDMPEFFMKMLSFNNLHLQEDFLFGYSNFLCLTDFHYLFLNDDIIWKLLHLSNSQ